MFQHIADNLEGHAAGFLVVGSFGGFIRHTMLDDSNRLEIEIIKNRTEMAQLAEKTTDLKADLNHIADKITDLQIEFHRAIVPLMVDVQFTNHRYAEIQRRLDELNHK